MPADEFSPHFQLLKKRISPKKPLVVYLKKDGAVTHTALFKT